MLRERQYLSQLVYSPPARKRLSNQRPLRLPSASPFHLRPGSELRRKWLVQVRYPEPALVGRSFAHWRRLHQLRTAACLALKSAFGMTGLRRFRLEVCEPHWYVARGAYRVRDL